MNTLLWGQPEVDCSHLGIEVHIAQSNDSRNPANSICPDPAQLLVRHILASNIAINRLLLCRVAKLPHYVSDLFCEARVVNERSVKIQLLCQPVVITQP